MERPGWNPPVRGYDSNNRDLYATNFRSIYSYNPNIILPPQETYGEGWLSSPPIFTLRSQNFKASSRSLDKINERNGLVKWYGQLGVDISTRGIENVNTTIGGSDVKWFSDGGIASGADLQTDYIGVRNSRLFDPNISGSLPITNDLIVFEDGGISNPNPNVHYNTYTKSYKSAVENLDWLSEQIRHNNNEYTCGHVADVLPNCGTRAQLPQVQHREQNREGLGELMNGGNPEDYSMQYIANPIYYEGINKEKQLLPYSELNNSKNPSYPLMFNQHKIGSEFYPDHFSGNLHIENEYY